MRGGTYQASLEPLASITCERIGILPPLVPHVEPLSDARTPLADFFSILLDLELRFVQTGVDPPAREQIVMPAIFHQSAAIQDQNPIDIMECGQPMGDDEGGAPSGQFGQRFTDFHFCFRINVGGRFVEDHDGGIFQQHPRD